MLTLLHVCIYTDDEVDETSISRAAKLNFEASETTAVSCISNSCGLFKQITIVLCYQHNALIFKISL